MDRIDINYKDYILPKIHREGLFIIIIAAVIAVLLALIWKPLGAVGLIMTAFVIYFFRDPKRYPPIDENSLVSPADGIVQMVGKVTPPKDLKLGSNPMMRVSVFMSVFNCHVNRIPITGKVTEVVYKPGKFINVSNDKDSEDNEKNMIKLEVKKNIEIGVIQIAGLIARRIVCDAEKGDNFKTGDRFGIIKFGSRLDVYLPDNFSVKVRPGQTMIAGETVIADLKEIKQQSSNKTNTKTNNKKTTTKTKKK